MINEWKGLHEFYITRSQKFDFIKKTHKSVSAVMFCKQFLAYAVHID